MNFRITFIVMLFVCCFSYGQQTITGSVVDEGNTPLMGVSIVVANTTNGTTTDFDGNYTINAAKGDVLTFSSMGFKTKQITVLNAAVINVTLLEDAAALEEVVVTALGIKREKKALGYAVQEVKGASLEKAKEPNLVNSLTGKVAGLNIKNSTDLFQNPKISLRGATPLVVIDGIPDRSADIWKINSDDVESISVLKGATASALYGSAGRNGAIMITSKKGEKGRLTVTVNSSVLFQPSFIKVPDVQRVYGNGNQGQYAYISGLGSGSEGGGWIWGPKVNQLDPSTASGFFETTQYNSPTDAAGNLIPIPFTSRGKDNIKDFFQTGSIQTNNVSVNWGNDKASYRMSVSNVYQKGIVPNTDLGNTSFAIGGTLNPSDNFKVSSNLTYNKQYTDNFPEVGYGPTNYLYNLVLWTGVDVDVKDLRNYWREGQEGYQQRHFNVSYYNNPYFQAYEYERGYDKDNIYGNVAFEYNITPELSVKSTSGINVYSLNRTYKEPKSYVGYGNKSLGNFTNADSRYFDIITDFGLKFEKNFSDNFTLKSEVAYSNYYRKSTAASTQTDGLNIPGFYNFANNAGVSYIASNLEQEEAIKSVYGFVDMSFYNAFYLSITGRNDKVSTLPKENNSFFYPSVSGSLVLSSLFDMPQAISFAKLRGSWSRVSEGKIGDDPYSYIQAYDKGTTWNGNTSASFGSSLLSPGLEPETSDTWEVGANVRLFNNRLGLDVAYFEAKDYNNLIYSPISEGSGYESVLLNGDEYKRKGLEFVFDAKPIQTANFSWDMLVNFSRFRRFQEEIYGDREQTEGFVKVGERTDQIYANVYQTNSSGEVIYENGFPVNDPYQRYIGDDDPDWTYGITNTFKYKNLNLSFLFDGRIGGLIYSTTNQKMWWGGKHKGTVNQFRDDANNGVSSYVAPGVKVVSGTATYDVNGNITSDTRTYAPNDVAVNYINFMQTTSNGQNKNYHYYKESFVKLREVTLTYNFPKKALTNTPIHEFSLSLIGRNLWLNSDVPNVDPDSGVDALQAPSTRNIGLNLNVKF
ncbi:MULTISPECIES: SusC/RagA family TonB-linked outer membrane protein [unclassified Cellulophaga]|uniref:SusC/RagA family TonB-linked outer membrane protein n=1 Tax=unclassified Cellulophaga TaxID=2634405 RepID=UPI0026E46459|nr:MULTISPECIES: SusC/RagA family TonB-linked outer membrane protein [unclassified Cellulophaga]MDO6490026.1 SusC/RagA family TonB-linked outer membrane protein [Cellulophaga sp. 2_MG-2023]MDO6494780.1 SusC/RagA family TonB-linked outer membrane protein [Cellulophaga sp. 3_MG-2023]